MNKLCYLIILFITCEVCDAQIPVEKFFYDKEGNKTDSTNAFNYSIYHYDDSTKKAGTVIKYSSNGNMTSETHYSNIAGGKLEGIYKYYYETGELKSTGNYSAHGLEGNLITYYRDGKIKRKDNFKDGKFMDGNCYTSSGEDTVHFDYEIMPQFPGGEKELINFLSNNVKYPFGAKLNAIQGEVVVNFIINKTGEVEKVRIIKSVHPKLDKEALKVIHKMPGWMPGFQDGEPISVQYNLPIRFTIK
ncbi:MAG TPA: TonB family protein [Bacteroidia bacterium]|nr:TonB family protein [Bacteroidia bacterium]